MWPRIPLLVAGGLALLLASACSGGGNDFPEQGAPGGQQPPPSSEPPPDTTPPPAQDPPPSSDTGGTQTGSTGGSGTTGSGGSTGGTDGGSGGTQPPTPTDCRTGDNDCCKRDGNCCNRDGAGHCRDANTLRTVGDIELGMGAPPGVVPQVLQDFRGDLVAVWRTFDGLRHDLWGNHYRGGAWSTPQRLEARDDDIGAVHLALDANGDALVVFDQGDGREHPIWAARYVNGTGWQAPVVISMGGTAGAPVYAFSARVVVDGSGNAVATWRQFDASPFARLWSNRYAPAGGWATPAPLDSQ